MAKIVETMDKGDQRISLKVMLEQMAQELSPRYRGKIVVKEFIPDPELPFMLVCPTFYVVEKRRRRVLGVFPLNDYRDIFGVRDRFYGVTRGEKIMSALLADVNAEDVVMKHLDRYAKDNEVTKIQMQRGL